MRILDYGILKVELTDQEMAVINACYAEGFFSCRHLETIIPKIIEMKNKK